jgi:hypothetical protein
VSILTAENLARAGLRHGFTTRLGGVSQGPYASLNISGKGGDAQGAVLRNRARFEALAGFSWGQLVGLNQVHSTAVLRVDRPAEALPGEEARRFDASVTLREDLVLGVRTADCIPILLYSADPRAVGAAHAGWRGTLAGVAGATVKAMQADCGCRPDRLLAAIGPGIHACCYTVGEDVFGPFAQRFGAGVALRGGDGAGRVDLVEANRLQLLGAGLSEANIEILDFCTCCRSDLFYSFRRDHGVTGRHQAFISLRAGPR